MVAPRASACSSVSSTVKPAPSAITKPSRAVSNGRDARSGSSLRLLIAPMRANADTVSGVTGASVAPAMTTSALPSRTMRTPSPMALAPAAHAVEMQRAGPVKPKRIEIIPAAALGIIIGTKNGLTRLAPRVRNVDSFSSIVSRPPTPVAAITAHRLGSAPSSPASLSASAAAPKPSCVKRSTRRASFGLKYSGGSYSRTSPANRTGSSDASKRSMILAVPRPARTVSQNESIVTPAGVFTPMPVTTTRGRPCASRSSVTEPLPSSGLRSQLGEDEVDRLADGADVLEVFFGYRDVEALLEAHDQLDQVEAVGVEVFLEAGVFHDGVGVHAQHLDRDFTQCGEDFCSFHCFLL